MMQGKARFRMVLVRRSQSIPLRRSSEAKKNL
jgi:hypothetical protein